MLLLVILVTAPDFESSPNEVDKIVILFQEYKYKTHEPIVNKHFNL